MRNKFLVVGVLVTLLSCKVMSPADRSPRQDYLFDTITFEIAPISSRAPAPRALDRFRNRLAEHNICRAENVTFLVQDSVSWDYPIPWQSDTLVLYERQHRTLFNANPQSRNLFVFIAYVDGPFLSSKGMRWLGGVQYANSAFAVFKHNVDGREASVLLHEFGHMIGLIKDRRLPNHDAKNAHHCMTWGCAMRPSASGVDADYCPYCKRQIAELIRDRR